MGGTQVFFGTFFVLLNRALQAQYHYSIGIVGLVNYFSLEDILV